MLNNQRARKFDARQDTESYLSTPIKADNSAA